MQNSPSKFFQNLFQFSNFAFVYFGPLSFKFFQLRSFCQLLLKKFEKKCEKYF